jgi:hypothetical protein
MPMTFGQVWTSIKNQALVQFQPILKKLNEIANSEQFNRLAAGVTTALVVVSGIVTEIFELVAAVGGFIYDNWSMIAPVVGAVTTALGIYAGYLAVTNGLELISKGIKLASIVANLCTCSSDRNSSGSNNSTGSSTNGIEHSTVGMSYHMDNHCYNCPDCFALPGSCSSQQICRNISQCNRHYLWGICNPWCFPMELVPGIVGIGLWYY